MTRIEGTRERAILPPFNSNAAVTQRQSLIVQDGVRWDQDAVENARVLVNGVGNIGSAAAAALGAARFGAVDLIDRDIVTPTTLSRGAGLFERRHVGRPKAEVVAERLRDLYGVDAQGFTLDIRADWGVARFGEYDVVLLATHDFPSRLHVNRWVHRLPGRTRAIIEGAIGELSYSVQTIIPGRTPCYGCRIVGPVADPEESRGCDGIVVGVDVPPAPTNGFDGMVVGALMAKEAALVCAGLRPFLAGRELRFDADAGTVDIAGRALRRSCEDHVPLPADRLLPLGITQDDAVADVRRRVAQQLGVSPAGVWLYSPFWIIRALRCACGGEMPVMLPEFARLRPRCPACGNVRLTPDQFQELTDDPDRPTLRDFGIVTGQLIEAYPAPGECYYVLPGPSGRFADVALAA